ncbi:hypothetical protein AKJ16_DCAP10268, partial [Drosera capensis]
DADPPVKDHRVDFFPRGSHSLDLERTIDCVPFYEPDASRDAHFKSHEDGKFNLGFPDKLKTTKGRFGTKPESKENTAQGNKAHISEPKAPTNDNPILPLLHCQTLEHLLINCNHTSITSTLLTPELNHFGFDNSEVPPPPRRRQSTRISSKFRSRVSPLAVRFDSGLNVGSLGSNQVRSLFLFSGEGNFPELAVPNQDPAIKCEYIEPFLNLDHHIEPRNSACIPDPILVG